MNPLDFSWPNPFTKTLTKSSLRQNLILAEPIRRIGWVWSCIHSQNKFLMQWSSLSPLIHSRRRVLTQKQEKGRKKRGRLSSQTRILGFRVCLQESLPAIDGFGEEEKGIRSRSLKDWRRKGDKKKTLTHDVALAALESLKERSQGRRGSCGI